MQKKNSRTVCEKEFLALQRFFNWLFHMLSLLLASSPNAVPAGILNAAANILGKKSDNTF